MAHTEWHLKLDNGSTCLQNGHPILDPTVPAAAAWWASIPLGGINGTGMYGNFDMIPSAAPSLTHTSAPCHPTLAGCCVLLGAQAH